MEREKGEGDSPPPPTGLALDDPPQNLATHWPWRRSEEEEEQGEGHYGLHLTPGT